MNTASAAPIRFYKAGLVGGVLEEGEGSVVELLARCFFPGGHFGGDGTGYALDGLDPEGNAGEKTGHRSGGVKPFPEHVCLHSIDGGPKAEPPFMLRRNIYGNGTG